MSGAGQPGADMWRQTWESDTSGRPYGDLFFDRATGKLPEMESSKAAAQRIGALAKDGDSLLDVGCGGGHYYRSIRSRVTTPLRYTGLDATPYYVERARAAFAGDNDARFVVGDIFAIDFPDRSFDLVMCNNVLLHLPNIVKPLRELCRVARRQVLVRTLVGEKSYVIQDVNPGTDGEDFDADGKPLGFHYLNIYGEAYVRHLLAKTPRVARAQIEVDREFSPERIADTARAMPGAWDATKVTDGMQHSGPIGFPWQWITIDLAQE